ncbi:SGNH/GDSL hydrolase family protein [soil metagenome]
MLRAAALCSLVLMLAGCDKSHRTVMAPSHAKSFLALGDSYTIGESVAEADRWPVQLAARLRSEQIDLTDPVIIAKTGWTTDELSAAIDTAKMDAKRFDLVTLLIGVNNQYRGRTSDEFREQFNALLARAIAFASGDARRVVVLSIPDWGVTPFAEGRDRGQIAREIDLLNQIAREKTEIVGARFVDITPLSRKFPALVADDGLHPSAKMYEHWASAAFPAAREALK